MRTRREQRTGTILLEALIALTLIGVAALATLSVARADSARALRLIERDREMHVASAFLDAASLWSRSELDARLGTRLQGRWLLHIARPAPTLYTLELLDAEHEQSLLVTAVFRPEVSDGMP